MRIILFLATLPLLLSAGYDGYLYYINDKAFLDLASLGYIWANLHPGSLGEIKNATGPESWKVISVLLKEKATLLTGLLAGFSYIMAVYLVLFRRLRLMTYVSRSEMHKYKGIAMFIYAYLLVMAGGGVALPLLYPDIWSDVILGSGIHYIAGIIHILIIVYIFIMLFSGDLGGTIAQSHFLNFINIGVLLPLILGGLLGGLAIYYPTGLWIIGPVAALTYAYLILKPLSLLLQDQPADHSGSSASGQSHGGGSSHVKNVLGQSGKS